MNQDKMLKSVELSFNGNAGEYFRIWIVNVLLSIVTLGVYSAWAKVRNKQYFYANTILDGSPFEYNASPIAILKGRLVVVAILALYYVLIHFYPLSEGLFLIVFFLILPWLVMRSLMFNARYSSYRNLHFSFEKNLSAAVKTFLGLGILIPLTLGLIYPYYMHSIQKYRVDNHGFGQFRFHFKSDVKAFYKYYMFAFLIIVLAIIVMSVFYGGVMSALTGLNDPQRPPQASSNAITAIFVMTTIYLLAYFVAFAYIKTRVFNKVWSNTELNRPSARHMSTPIVPLMSFKGDLEVKPMFIIYFTNTLAIVLSMGLLIPWAKIRLAKYRIENLHASSLANLKVITAKQRENIGTIGSEMGDILDIDIGM